MTAHVHSSSTKGKGGLIDATLALLGDTNMNASMVANTVAAVTSTSLLCYFYTYWNSQKNKKALFQRFKGGKSTQLLSSETSMAMFESVQAISTLTWYECNNDSDGDAGFRSVASRVRERVEQMVRANPWLKGRLLRTTKGKVSLVYHDSTSAFSNNSNNKNNKGALMVDDSVFRIYDDSNISLPQSQGTNESIVISRDMPYTELPALLNRMGCLVGRGIDIVDQDRSFFRVSLLVDTKEPKKRFALVVSLAHCVGDGHTFYSLHNMLDTSNAATTEIRALDPTRKPELLPRMADTLGGRDQAASLAEPPAGFIVRFLKGTLASLLLGPPTKVSVFWIHQDWIERERKQAKLEDPALPFVSSNDILTSRFFQISGTDQGIMAINFRSKVKGCEVNDAGNYFNYLVCRPEDYRSPARIRSAVRDICADTRQPATKPMTSWEHITSSQLFAATSNWSSFYKPVKLKHCRQDVHVPVIPCDSVSCPSRFVTGLFILQPNVNQAQASGGRYRIAAMFAGPPKVYESLEKSGMVGPSAY